MTATVRVVIVGSGKRAREHLTQLYDLRERSYLGTPPDTPDPPEDAYSTHASDAASWTIDVSGLDAAVTALVDPAADQRARTASRCTDAGDDPAEFDSIRAFLASDATADADAAIVTTPNDTHPEIVRHLLGRDFDVLCEKPLATTVDGHRRVAEAARTHDGVFYPAFNLRSSPFFRTLKRLVDEGRIGDLGSMTCHEVRRPLATGYRYDRERSGGSLLEKNCHDFDMFNWLADGDPTRVHAAGGQHVLDAGTDVDDQAAVVVEYDDGTLATLELCLYAPWNQRERRYELRGSEGLLRTPEDPLAVDHHGPDGTERIEVAASGHHLGGDYYQAWRFLRCVRGEDDPPGTVAEATAAAAVALAARTAIERETTVHLDSEDHALSIE